MSTTLREYARQLRKRGLLDAPLRSAEWLIFGGRTVEALLVGVLRAHYKSRFRRDWLWRKESPHFFNNRMAAFEVVYAGRTGGPHGLYRGFLCSEMIRNGDRVLDIGCGDGFFTKHFFAPQCEHVDAVDIEPSAITAAKRENAAPNIDYHLLDAVERPFPRDAYDVIVWDGAIGHFPVATTERMLDKIANSLTDTGVFVGSESLGNEEGHDHLQFFESIQDLDRAFREHFAYRAYRVASYPVGNGDEAFIRREAYWRCSNNADRPLNVWQSGDAREPALVEGSR